MRFLLLCVTCAISLTALAQEPRQSITVYSSSDADLDERLGGFAVVRDIRRITLNKGDNLVKFPDVAAAIDPTTVSFRSLTAPDSTSVVEQSFAYDLTSTDRLLEKYVGKAIIVNRKLPPLPTDRTRMPETIEAKLLAFTADQLVLQTNNKQLPIQIIPRNADIVEIKLFDLQPGLVTTPTLLWSINADQAGDHHAEVTYQTDRLAWSADYSIVLNKEDTKSDLSAWVTLQNESGAAFTNAKFKLIAGDLHRLRRPALAPRNAFPDKREARERLFSDYHTYVMPRPISLAGNSTKQIELFRPKSNVSVAKVYVYRGIAEGQRRFTGPAAIDRDLGLHMNKRVDVYLELANTQKTGLGMPLPAGRVRFYKRDADDPDAPLEFIGEDAIDHTPTDKRARVRLGSAFDIVGERRQTDFNVDAQKKMMSESFEIKLRNHKKEPAQLIVREALYRAASWEIGNESLKHEKVDARTIQFALDVPATGEKVITYTVTYTW